MTLNWEKKQSIDTDPERIEMKKSADRKLNTGI